MFFGNKRRRRPQSVSAPVQALEAREMKSATVGWDGATLRVEGSAANDSVLIRAGTDGQTSVAVSGVLVSKFPSASVKTIAASMKEGSDSLVIDLGGRFTPTVQVDMGTGVTETFSLKTGSVGNLSFASNSSGKTSVDISRVNVSNLASLNFQGTTSRDWLNWYGGSVNQLSANLGQGDDRVDLESMTITSVNMALGDGNDQVSLRSVKSSYGTFNAGAGYDTFYSTLGRGGYFLIDFEG